ncbi:MAG: hypothetical protein WEA10_07595 [Actinomycetota bacterium]
MRPVAGALVAGVAAAISFLLWRGLERTGLHRRLARENFRGARLSLTLGVALGIGIVGAGCAVVAVVAERAGWAASPSVELLGIVLVLLAGIVDDVVPGRARGLRGHLREIAHGRVTTGILKAAAAVLGAVFVVADAGGGPWWGRVAGVVLVAGCANLWNLLDVRPGRAAKAYVIAALALTAVDPGAFLFAVSGPVVVLGWFDLRERGMFGDTGANVLGFVIGAEAYLRLPAWAVAVGAVVVVGLTILGETVTFSRMIDAFAPLGWLDRLGRVAPTRSPPA